MPAFNYPPARKADVVDDYHGTPVTDPYRWAEDPDSDETRAFVAAQAALARDYLDEIPARQTLIQRLTTLYDFPKPGLIREAGGRQFYTYNDGLRNQPLLYVKDSADAAPRLLLDPNILSEDGTVALVNWQPSPDGSKLAYLVSDGGSDAQVLHVRDVDSGMDHLEQLQWCRFTGVAWAPDSTGFYYNRYPTPGTVPDEDLQAYNRVYYHALSTPQDQDVLTYEEPENKELLFWPQATDDGEMLVINVSIGAINRGMLYLRDRAADNDAPFTKLIDAPDAEYRVVGKVGRRLYVYTDWDAPRSRIMAVDLDNIARVHWREIVPQGEAVLDQAQVVGGHLVVIAKENAQHRVLIYTLDGALAREVALPGPGTVPMMHGKESADTFYFMYSSYLTPFQVLRCEVASGAVTVEAGADAQPINADAYVTEQVWYPSKDGTQVSMFLTYKRGLEKNGDNPTLLYGYGGFSISLMPMYAPQIPAWLEMGGIYAAPNLRGGAEYGEEWHAAGMLGNKQNVFDDFIAAAEWLIAQGYTRREKLAINGGSNGGLLVSACEVQRPDLFGAVICQVPVADMLRYHKFTAGRYWVPEYGNAEADPEHFKFLYAYSPVHNVQPGTAYPPTLILTADGDDRVVPMHALKFTAAMQDASSGEAPVLLRFESRAGHGMGKPTTKLIEQHADVFAFLMQHFEMR